MHAKIIAGVGLNVRFRWNGTIVLASRGHHIDSLRSMHSKKHHTLIPFWCISYHIDHLLWRPRRIVRGAHFCGSNYNKNQITFLQSPQDSLENWWHMLSAPKNRFPNKMLVIDKVQWISQFLIPKYHCSACRGGCTWRFTLAFGWNNG